MDLDPLTMFQTPPTRKIRRLHAVQPSPPKLSDLLAAFGAKRLPTSVSKMQREASRGLRPLSKPFSYAESEGSNPSPQSSPESNFGTPLGSLKTPISLDDTDSEEDGSSPSDAEDELQSGDVIQVAPRRSNATRELPKRSTRSHVSYATPKKIVKKKSVSKKGRKSKKSRKLTSDLIAASKSKIVPLPIGSDKAHQELAKTTASNQAAFLLANQEYFLPLLPENNYITKLELTEDGSSLETFSYVEIASQPKGILATMKPYQLEGLSFLAHMCRNGMSAILGDEMGLGKTLQTLALLQYLKNENSPRKTIRPFLIICPLSVLTGWMNEAKKWIPDLKLVRFHGPKAEREKLKEDCRDAKKASKIDGIVTTYESFVAEQNWFKRAFVYRCCVLDEGHKIKNPRSNVAHALQSLNAAHRLLLTGTPLQNNLLEMWALLHWLYPEVFDDRTAENFQRAFDLTRGKVATGFMNDARRLLELIMLRRMKHSPGVDLDLPPKEEILLYTPLTPVQIFWYKRLLTSSDQSTLDELFRNTKEKELKTLKEDAEDTTPEAGQTTIPTNPTGLDDDVWAESKELVARAIQNEGVDQNNGEWRKLMNLVLQLRKVCGHPYVLSQAVPEPYYLGEHVKAASGKFIVLDKLIDELVYKQGKKILIFAGLTRTLDLCEDLLCLKGFNTDSLDGNGFRFLRFDGGTSRARRNLGIRMFNDLSSDFKIMLISTRAGGLGINLTSASDVVFLDEDWNPQVTIQAEARAHRIGQTKKVTIYKLCSAGTVEEQMLGRIRKKLYLSAKITENIRNVHSSGKGKKRKRESGDNVEEEEAPQLDATSLKSLIRRGAQTLARPTVDVTEMMGWDFDTMIEKCKDKPIDTALDGDFGGDKEEEAWLNSMEKVECAVFEGKKHSKKVKEEAKGPIELARADRRFGKNTTVMIDGFAISKESMNCGDWEAVPTMSGKGDLRLAEPVRAMKEPINHQEICQCCRDGGAQVLCKGCPRSYHFQCLHDTFKQKSKGMAFHCPQHECVDCQAKTADAGGMIYRCRWCERGYCEDCLDFDTVRLIGETLPEYDILHYGSKENAWYIECPHCVENWQKNKSERAQIFKERERIGEEYESFVASKATTETSSLINTPVTVSEVGTPRDVEIEMPSSKKMRLW